MRIKAQFLLFALVFGIGFAGGLYVHLLLPERSSDVIDVSSIILAIFGGMGLMFTLGKWVYDWYNQPTLEIVGIVVHPVIVPAGETFLDHYVIRYHFLRISNIRKKGAAVSCRGNLDIANTAVSNIPSHWRRSNESRTVDISTTEDLALFATIEKHNQIFFPTITVNKGHLEGGRTIL